jgi:hypothetical protein
MRLRERIREARSDGAGGVACVVITEGLGNLRDANFYLPSAIKSAAKAIDGAQAYINHPSESEEDDRPERSLWDLAGWWTDPRVGTVKDPHTGEPLTALFATLRFDSSETGQYARSLVETALQHAKKYPNSKGVYAGISINGGGVSKEGFIDGRPVNLVSEIQELFSADLVTKPARGGKFVALVESRRGSRRRVRPQRPFGTTAIEAMAIFSESYRKQLRQRGGVLHD